MTQQVYVFPASPAQRRLWFLDQLQGPSSAYSLVQALDVAGALDREALTRAFRDLVARHESLRTALVAVDGEPLQAIEPELAFAPAFESFEGQPAANRMAAARARLATVLAQPFDLTRAPLMRVLLLRLEPERHLLGIALQHAVCDGQSLAVLVEELAHLYRRACGETVDALPELPIQYGDYAAWLEDARDDTAGAASLAYWTARLRAVPPLALPTDRPAPALLPPDGARHEFRVAAEVVRALENSAREAGASPFMLWLALWSGALGQAAGQSDFCLGVPVAGRGRPELERLVGLFANTLALRVDLSGQPALGALLQRMRAVVLEGFAHQDTPFETLVEALKVPRGSGRSPLFQSLFALHENPLDSISLPGLRLQPLDLPQVSAKVEVTLELTRRADGGLDGRLEYSSVLFEPATARRLAEALCRLADEWRADPLRPLRLEPAAARAIASTDAATNSAADPAAGPGTALERTLAALWQELLGVEDVARQDSFFDLGGHSLLACRLVARLRQRLSVELPVAAVFEAPNLAAMAERLQRLLDTQASGRVPPTVAIESAPLETAHPLSPAQTRLWFLQQLESQSPAYSLLGALEIEGPLDVELLRLVLQALERRHAVLRARFRLLDGEPIQLMGAPRGLALPVVDLEPLPDDAREREVRRIGQAEAREPFDLVEGPPIRLKLLRHSARRHVLLAALHHIVADGWSLELLLAETATLYRAFAEERPSPLPPLALQYGDYAAWQRRALDAGRTAALVAFWRERLAGLQPLELPTDRPRPPVQTAEGARHDFRLEPALSAGVARLAAETGATRFHVLLAVFVTLLARYSGQTDFAVGVPTSGRERPETQDLVGCFVNTLVLRAELSDAPSFRDLVARLRVTALEAQAHQDLPFETLVDALALERDLSRNALFQVLFNYQAASLPQQEIPGLAIRHLEIDPGVAQFDLALYLDERDASGDGLGGGFVYRTDLYDSGTIVRLEGHFRQLLESVLATPDMPVDRLPLLTEEERRRLADWNDTRVNYDLPPRLIDLIDAQAARTPDAVAAVAEEGRLTYAELLGRANALAGALAAAGAGPGRPVGVCLERSVSLIVALVAVLRTGAPFLPLDPEQPEARLAQMLEDANPSLIVTTPELARVLPEATPWIDVAGEGEPLEGPPAIGAEDPAYLLFTSGSTGRPKGALNSQRGILNRLAWMQQFYPIGPRDRVLQKTPYSFDVSVWEFFWPLIAGARLYFARPGGHRDPDYLAATIARSGITVVHFVPSMLEAFLPAADPVACSSLRHVFLSGEALSAELERRFFARGLSASLHNLYGPTEAAIDVSAWSCLPPGGRRTPPIGYAAPNCQLHVLDPHGQPVPVGVPGELFLGGAQVGLGYLGRPELTAERFLPDPFAGESGRSARLYRTGDRARRLADGAIEFLGRLDFQVKLRGQRIELGDIEAALLAHPGVRSAVAALWGDTPSTQRLVAYVVPAAADSASRKSLRRHLEQRLPGYMVPEALVLLDALPLNASGKLDRGRLPAPERPPAAPGDRPMRDNERAVAEVWCAVLKLESVAPDANFFEAGGNSLLLVQVHARLKARWPDLSLVDLFRFPTVESLAGHLSPTTARPQTTAETRPPRAAPASSSGIAIVGMACRFPGAHGIEDFWRLLTEGREAIERLEETELRAAGVPEALLADPRYVPVAAAPDGVELFDADFFLYSPTEAAELDPQGRLFLECAWQALERSGIDPSRPGGPVGVYAGSGLSGYGMARLAGQGGWAALQTDPTGAFQALAANDKDYLASRVAYKLGLTGPAVGVQTACSTSLVAIHMACQALTAGECRTALAGGASISVPSRAGYLYQEGGIASADGHCRAFDAAAGGTVPASGVGVVVLKRLSDALADGDPIHAVIRGTAINNDGNARVSFTAPGVEGQAAVIAAAQAAAGVVPKDIGYVEAHGTATQLGDLIEIGGLTRAFGRLGPEGTPASASVGLGSVKTNLGHLDTAAGVAGLIKAALAVEHALLPASLHYRAPSPRLDLSESPFFVNGELRAWSAPGLRRAGVSSFGIGGTNAHAVIEQAPPRSAAGPARRWQLLPVSATTSAALSGAGETLADWLEARPDADLASVAYTLQVGRRGFAERRFVVASGARTAAAALRSAPPASTAGRLAVTSPAPVALLFTGQGSQFPGMGAGLSEGLPLWRETVERCLAALPEALAVDLRQLVLEPAGGDGRKASLLRRTELAQPALFLVEVGLALQLQAWGLRPAALLGHSLGELAAATVAGVFRLEDAVRLVALRGRLMQAQPVGTMLAVEATAEELAPLLGGALAVAALNAPGQTVVGGPEAEVAALAARLAGQGIASQSLHTSHAFHNPSMAAAMAPFAEAVAAVERRVPELPVLSNLTGDWLTEEQALDPDYWARQLCEPVRFAAALETLLDGADPVLLEVGPGRALLSLARQNPACGKERVLLPCLPGALEEAAPERRVMEALGGLWLAGVELDWRAVHAPAAPLKLALPGHPLDRKRHWLEPGAAGTPRLPEFGPVVLQPAWVRFADRLPRVPDVADLRWRVEGAPKAEAEASGAILAEALRQAGAEVVETGPCDALLLCVPEGDAAEAVVSRLGPLLAEARPRRLHLLTLGAQDVLGNEALGLAGAAADAAALVAAQEMPELELRALDIEAWPLETAGARRALAALCAPGPRRLALRHDRLWRPDLRTETLPETALPEGAVVLITGGFGGVGLAIARRLSARGASLVLCGRDGGRGRAAERKALEAAGATVMAARCDVADSKALAVLVARALKRFGRLDAVVHAAGIAGEAAQVALQETDAATVERLFRAKLQGARNLAEALRDLPDVPVLLCSSLSTTLGGLGFAAYAAANAALDALVLRLTRDEARPWLAVDWDGWRLDPDASAPEGLAPPVGAALAERLLTSGRKGRLLVTARPLGPRLELWVEAAAGDASAAPHDATASLASSAAQAFLGRGHAGQDFAAPRSGLEAAVAEVWRETLGVPEIGVEDDFFSLGGHSLLALRMLTRLQQVAGVPLSLRAVLEAPTVAQQARTIEALRWQARAPEAESETAEAAEEEGEI